MYKLKFYNYTNYMNEGYKFFLGREKNVMLNKTDEKDSKTS